MESLLSLLRMHRDHEPRGGGRRRASVLDCGSPLPLLRPRTRSESARGLAHSKTWRHGGRFMGRLHSLWRMRLDLEPAPNPSQEGIGQDADECRLPSWEGSGVGRFLEAILAAVRTMSGTHLQLGLNSAIAPTRSAAFLSRLSPRFWPLLFFLACSCVATRPPELNRFEFSQPQMGLPFHVVLYAPDQVAAEAAARAAFDRIRQLNDSLSDYDTDSELSRLSQTAGSGQAVKLSDDLWFVLERSRKLAEQTQGAFDVTVGPVVSLWRKARREKKLPDPAKLAEALKAVGYQELRLDAERHTAQLLARHMLLDLGAIAKGYAADEALKVLRTRGITRALVSGGGDMAAGDPPPGKKGWRIESAPIDATNAPVARFVLLARAGLATSGDLFQHLEIDGKRYSHIVDPRTGIGLTDHSLVTVIARDGITADSLATAVSVLGPEKGVRLVEKTKGAAVHITRMPGNEIEASESPRFRRYYEVAPK